MKRLAIVLAVVVAAACGGAPATDAGGGGMDAGPRVDAGPVSCASDSECPTYCNPGSMLCCIPTFLPYDICGDRIDQNCDRHDTSCGDNDGDGTQACRPGEDPIGGICDCDDERDDVRPPFGTLPGAQEHCDAIDNDCNGRVDESAECCDACASLGAARDRADICTEANVCDCSTDAASGPCGEGLTCCAAGCVDLQNDYENCGACTARCTVSSDRCVAGGCACGAGSPCELDIACAGGTCG